MVVGMETAEADPTLSDYHTLRRASRRVRAGAGAIQTREFRAGVSIAAASFDIRTMTIVTRFRASRAAAGCAVTTTIINLVGRK